MLSNGKEKEAEKVLRQISKSNKITFNEKSWNELLEHYNKKANFYVKIAIFFNHCI